MRRVILMSIIVIGMASFAAADAPALLNFQGLLKDGSGTPVPNGNYSVTFTIYDAASGGNAVWTETQSVATENGLFAVLLGSTTPVVDTVFAAPTRYLGTKVDADPEMTPRTMLVTVPYALRVATIDGASGGHITGKVSIGSGHTNTGNYTFVAGYNSKVTGHQATVAGGWADSATANESSVGGGAGNWAGGYASTVAGGQENIASGYLSTVAGGGSYPKGNQASGSWSAIGGGELNRADGSWSTVGGGGGNSASNTNAVVAGGAGDTASGVNSAVGGGGVNVASGTSSTVGGGQLNRASDSCATIGGGTNNVASGPVAHVGGGGENRASGQFAVVAGGYRDSATATFSTVAGGGGNWSGAWAATVGGGQENIAGGAHATVAGGGGYPLGNVAGGIASTIGGGARNAAPGDASTIPGGVDNSTQGRFAFAAGRRAKALHDGAFVWGDTTETDFSSTGPNQFLIRAGGGVGIGTATPVAALDVNGSVAVGSGTPIQKILGASAVLNFPSVASLGSAELDIVVTGASDGDAVSLGIPAGSILPGAIYWGYVSSANTVTIRFTNASGVAANPASGTFRAMVTKF